MLAGSLVSGVQLAVSMSNTGGAWDNTKKYIEAGASSHARELGGKGSDCHKVGDALRISMEFKSPMKSKDLSAEACPIMKT